MIPWHLASRAFKSWKKSDTCKHIAFSSFETSMESSCSDKQPRSHLQPLAATCRLQPQAATCNHLSPLAQAASCSHLPGSHKQPQAATSSHLPAATCPAATCPAATSSHKQPLAATFSHLSRSHLQPLASGCKWLLFWKSKCASPAPLVKSLQQISMQCLCARSP